MTSSGDRTGSAAAGARRAPVNAGAAADPSTAPASLHALWRLSGLEDARRDVQGALDALTRKRNRLAVVAHRRGATQEQIAAVLELSQAQTSRLIAAERRNA